MSPETSKSVYLFNAEAGPRGTDGNAKMKDLLGGKGANLAEMANLGIPVPPGFTISTQVCTEFFKSNRQLPEGVMEQTRWALAQVEKRLDKKFADPADPLLLSVRSGSRVSMPGMMDTILNLGLNDQSVEGLSKKSQNPRFAWDSYRRFVQMYSNVVMGMNSSLLEVLLEDFKAERNYSADTQITTDELKNLVKKFKEMIRSHTGQAFPSDPWQQLWGAIGAVFLSWHTPRAVTYRELNHIPEDWGTAVNVQSMVFGNMGDDSATGVAFTRNPSTGEKKFFGEYLINAQGEDVVAGIRTPLPIESLQAQMPQAYGELVSIYQKLEKHYRNMQDLEFTIEKGRLWMLQTRTGKRTARAALKMACDMIDEGLLSEREALLRIDPGSLDQLLHPTLDPQAPRTILAKGLPASPGGVHGQIVFTPEEAVALKETGLKAILVRIETSPEDIAGMAAAQGILTSRGGMTSHAAVVARGMGKCCVAGCSEIEVDPIAETLRARGYLLRKGEIITLDGSTGEVFLGEIKTIAPELSGDFLRIMKLSDKFRRLKIRTNADTPRDAQTARDFGAEGIGLCRTEHMFFGPDRIDAMREMILADHRQDRQRALEKLLPMQRSDFRALFEIMESYPVTIRLLDPPLHEFLPHSDKECEELAHRLQVDSERIRLKVQSLHEFNPMLGHRGCRLAITYPEIYRMQVRAIGEATCDLIKQGKKLEPEIMIPLILSEKELQQLRTLVEDELKEIQREQEINFKYTVGTMIELPRAAVMAEQIAMAADFFSFGTNDLTQTTLGLSRDDAGRFLPTYISQGIFSKDPFVSLDQKGVGFLIRMAIDQGKRGRPLLKTGICGEHGGDPDSIEFFNRVGLDYVSCSPFRVPAARLAAAKVNISSDTAAL